MIPGTNVLRSKVHVPKNIQICCQKLMQGIFAPGSHGHDESGGVGGSPHAGIIVSKSEWNWSMVLGVVLLESPAF